MVVARWQATIVNSTGDTVASAAVAVYSETTGALATIYSDRAGTVSITNPTTTDSEGFVGFYAGGDAYRIVATSGATSREFRYVGIGTSQEEDKQLVTVLEATFSGVANIIFSGLDNFRKIVMEFERLNVTVDTADIHAFISINDGVDFIGGILNHYSLDTRTAATPSLQGSTGGGFLLLADNLGTGSGEFYQGSITLLNHTDGSTFKYVNSLGSVYGATPALHAADMKGLVETGGSLTDFAVQPSSGLISGKVVVKGESI